MRPPSYYTSIAHSNDRNSRTGSSSSYLNSDVAGPTTRTPSQQLRSSFSSPSSSSYVNRSHLPFVPQSMLVAHCFTGVGSSTRPYGTSSTSTSGTSYTPTSRVSSVQSIPSGYLSPSRPVSKRSPTHHLSSSGFSSSAYAGGGSSSSYLPPRSPYLSTSTTSSSRYRPTAATLSSYYKPIRLRERPILTQISSRLNTSTANFAKSDEYHSIEKARKDESKSKTNKENDKDWSHDVARNISRNKYLIKFREIDKSNRSNVVSPLEPDKYREGASESVMVEPVTETIEPAKLVDDDSLMRAPEECDEAKSIDTTHVSDQQNSPTSDNKDNNINNCDTSAKKRVKKIKKKASEVRVAAVATTEKLPPAIQSEAASEPLPTQAAPKSTTSLAQTEPRETHGQKLALPTSKSDIDNKQQEKQEPDGSTNKTLIVKKERRNVKLKLRPIGSKQSEMKQQDTEQQESREPLTTSSKVKRLVKESSSGVKKTEDKTKEVDNKENHGRRKAGEDATTKRKLSNASDKLKIDTNLASMIKHKSDQQMVSGNSSSSAKSARIRFREYNYDDFNFLTVLGHGGWGFVILAELKEYDACFAVKCIKKITIVEDDDYDSIMIERKVLALGNVNPFICKLFCTFETDGYLFFVMEYCAGGDLMFHVQREGKFTESRSRFYASEIICAIRFLHNRHIIYRDLKLDNILLDARGHIRLVDFGMCQCRTYREEMLPSNFCGTPEYISPEIIKGVPYNHSVDWWSFGVLLYEMAVGKMPFRGNDENELLWNVCYEQIHYPMFLTKELTDLLKLLLEREPTKRMGMSTCKAGDIYDQPFFRGVNWKAVEELKVEPPFVPEVTSKRDARNFDSDFTESACELSPVDEKTLAKIEQNQFQNFPYTNPDIFMFEQSQ